MLPSVSRVFGQALPASCQSSCWSRLSASATTGWKGSSRQDAPITAVSAHLHDAYESRPFLDLPIALSASSLSVWTLRLRHTFRDSSSPSVWRWLIIWVRDRYINSYSLSASISFCYVFTLVRYSGFFRIFGEGAPFLAVVGRLYFDVPPFIKINKGINA